MKVNIVEAEKAKLSKVIIWEERDKLIEKGIDELNNMTLPEVANYKEAKIGCKGKAKYRYGYKAHNIVDMESGIQIKFYQILG